MRLFFFMAIFGLMPRLCYSQVGIGTTSPNKSSLLDVYADPLSPRGFLGPRVDLDNVLNSSIDGLNINAAGLLMDQEQLLCLSKYSC